MKDTFEGSWTLEDVTITTRNGQSITPEHSELGEIFFSEFGTFVSEGGFTLTEKYIEKLDNGSHDGQWECNDEYKQMKIDGCLWNVNIIDETKIELRASVGSLQETKEYYCLLKKK